MDTLELSSEPWVGGGVRKRRDEIGAGAPNKMVALLGKEQRAGVSPHLCRVSGLGDDRKRAAGERKQDNNVKESRTIPRRRLFQRNEDK